MNLALVVLLFGAPYAKSVPDDYYLEVIKQYESNQRVLHAALENDLELSDAYDLTIKLMGPSIYPPRREVVEYWEERDFDLLPFLISIAQMEELPFSSLPRSAPEVSQLNVLKWIALCSNPDSTAWLLGYVGERMNKPIETHHDLTQLMDILTVLGLARKDNALDLLFGIQAKKEWRDDASIRIDESAPDSKESIVYNLRKAALLGIAVSGTDRALRAFATGEGLADDMGTFDDEFSTAAHARFGIYDLSWHYQNGLAPEVEAELKALFDKYHMKYRAKEKFGPITDPTRPPRPVE